MLNLFQKALLMIWISNLMSYKIKYKTWRMKYNQEVKMAINKI